jgi:hypothetical protein
MDEHYKTLDDVKMIPANRFPMMCLCNGYSSAFGFLISLVTKDFWNHFQWLISPTEFASQWFWFTRFPVKNYAKHSLKFFYNPRWTADERVVLQIAIAAELRKSKWATRYDVIGVVGEAAGLKWLNSKRQDFCSEKINILSRVDKDCKAWLAETEASPTPEQVNSWLKAQKNTDGTPRYVVWGRVMPG